MESLNQAWSFFLIATSRFQDIEYVFMLIPFVLFFELPLYFVNWMSVFRYLFKKSVEAPVSFPYYPRVTCAITCYAEGKAVQSTVISLLEQIYPGHIEIIAMVDGVQKNLATYQALKELVPVVASYPKRSLVIIPKIQRGGRVSSLNAGLSRAQGEIFFALDGDTSFDNQMVSSAAAHFRNHDIVAVTGPMRVRNARKAIITRLQSLEYMLTMQVGKLGFAKLNVINNVPGAFGIFRKSFIQKIGGWNTGTAEDLDLTLRIKQYHQRYPHLRIEFEPGAVSHTDAPESFKDFLKQRLRWDGDLWYIYSNKHKYGISASRMGWSNFIFLLWYGILFQIVMPFSIVIYTVYMAIKLPILTFFLSMVLVYLFYLGLITLQYIFYLVLVSDRKWEDCEAALILPIYPLFQFVSRVWSAFAILNQILNKGHLDSAMAPLWVLKKGKQ
ncbi:MAG: N-acetylglucosaminyltransferase [Proteobacteria bacterium ST_bin16]|nr:MAG: N-acetylglucosaminyltransferase [Proteobacteria bacterium ST_bin16]